MTELISEGTRSILPIVEGVGDFIVKNPVATGAVGVGAAALGTGAIIGIARRRKKKSRRVKRGRHRLARRRSRGSRRKRKGGSRRRYTPHTAGKRKDRSTRRIRYTRKGQPYVILSSGKARFIKMTSARRSHRQKGGRY